MGSLGTASMSTRPSRCSTRKKQQRPFPRLFNLRPTDSIHVAGAAGRNFSSQQDGGASVLSKTLRDSIPSLQEGALDKAMGFQAQLAESQEELARTQSLVSAGKAASEQGRQPVAQFKGEKKNSSYETGVQR